MKQIIQNLRTGETTLDELPAPMLKPGYVLIKTRRSLISPGTERMLVEFSKAGILGKVLKQPEKARMVVEKIRTDGVLSSLKAVKNKLDQPVCLGYCNVGEVIAVGEGVLDVQVGDRVANNGPHAEIVCVSKNLVAKVPENVSDDQAVFTIAGAIALQGVRDLGVLLGETVVVLGLGLIGLLTAELLRISGCRVVGIDPDEGRLKIAESKGIIIYNPNRGSAEHFVKDLTGGIGADGIIIAAAAGGQAVMSEAVRLSRKRGKIVLVGVVDVEISRNEFYYKGLKFEVSCSYGPGRYDPVYEEEGVDYPVSYVRWTAKRNFEAILQMLSGGSLDIQPLISEVIPLQEFSSVYRNIISSKSIATIFHYPHIIEYKRTVCHQTRQFNGSRGVIGIIGAGNFTRNTLLPVLANAGLKYIASANGLSGASLSRKYNIANNTTDYKTILSDKEVDLVMITTRHDQHASMVIESLKAGKHVFVEKPLAIYEEELAQIINTYVNAKSENVSLTVGFNRRFAPHVQKMKSLLGDGLMNVVVTVNAGNVPMDSWIHERTVGGGRIIGEACHFIDLVSYLTCSPIAVVSMNAMSMHSSETTDNAIISLKCANGSTGAINYFSNGSKTYDKERIEVYSQGRTLILENFQTLTGYGLKGFSKMKMGQDKGHKLMFAQLLENIKSGGEPIIPFSEIVNSTRATFAALESWKLSAWVTV